MRSLSTCPMPNSWHLASSQTLAALCTCLEPPLLNSTMISSPRLCENAFKKMRRFYCPALSLFPGQDNKKLRFPMFLLLSKKLNNNMRCRAEPHNRRHHARKDACNGIAAWPCELDTCRRPGCFYKAGRSTLKCGCRPDHPNYSYPVEKVWTRWH